MGVSTEQFRQIMASFPTGVAIVTAVGAGREPRGMTSNAVCSVSVSPPLLLVCVDKNAKTLPAITGSGGFVVNFLAAGRDELSRRFAAKADNKFDGVTTRRSSHAFGAPILVDDAIAHAECTVSVVIDAGDHVLVLGRVESGCALGSSPLVYFRRKYATWPLTEPAFDRAN